MVLLRKRFSFLSMVGDFVPRGFWEFFILSNPVVHLYLNWECMRCQRDKSQRLYVIHNFTSITTFLERFRHGARCITGLFEDIFENWSIVSSYIRMM